MIPKGWSSQKLSSVASIIDCKHRTPEYVKSGIPLVSPGTIKWGAIDLISPVKRVTEEEYRSLMDHCVVEQGDLVMSRNQSVGVVSYVDSKKPFVLGQDTVLIKPIHADWRFIYYTLQSDLVQRQIAKSAGGSTFSRINLSDIRALNIKTPAICEQDKISQILSAWDKAISVTEKLLTNSQYQKKSLMQQLLTGKKRLLDENGERFSGEWKQDVNLGSIINISKGVQINKNTLSEDGQFPVINGGIAPSGFTSEFNTDENTITISEGGNSCGYVAFQKKSFWCGGHCYAVRKTALDLSFTFHLLKYNELKIMGLRVGSGLPNIQKKAIEAFTVNFPVTSVEQQKIAAVLSAADAEISTLEKKLVCLKNEKKALMQQLLTGKRRVSVPVKVEEQEAVSA
ncbi:MULTISPECIES: restriction endonuclease subunit S [unclassified Atlantibacter]|uniref:restriction endonuclease subunit S n=1 Tax=unclassified Atlantibacter TaxID=2649394 RepID=UPI001605CC74|nr:MULTISPECIES: restriction endonuclease subunit S [unclassified Atlantibacter]